MSRTLEITVLSAENLRVNQKPIKNNAFAIIQTDHSNTHLTKIDSEGGGNPSWNEKIVTNFPVYATFVAIEVHCKTSSGNRVVGTAKIPMTDIVGGYAPDSCLKFLSYRLRDRYGERNGIINVSVRVTPAESGSSAAQIRCGVLDDRGKKNESVVYGIPVNYKNEMNILTFHQ